MTTTIRDAPASALDDTPTNPAPSVPFLDMPHLLSSLLQRTCSSLVLSTWQVIEQAVVERGKLRATELGHVALKLVECPAENRTKLTERRCGRAGHGSERRLVEEASSVVAFVACVSMKAQDKCLEYINPYLRAKKRR